MDTIHITDLEVPTRIGITEQERSSEQVVKVCVWLRVDTKKAAETDDIADTIDYEQVAITIKQLGKTERNTIEKLAGDIAHMILDTFDTEEVSVSVRKYILPDTDGVAVTISRP